MRVKVCSCQRCGGDHEVEFQPLANPANEYAHWGMCPTLNQPILLAIVPDQPPPSRESGMSTEHAIGSNRPMDRTTHKPDGTPRHQAVAHVLKHFRYDHLPEHLQAISRPCGELAFTMADTLPENADLTVGLRDLLTAKDNFVRARLP